MVDRVQFDAAIKAIAAAGRHIYMPFREESIGAVATDRVRAHERATASDPWDGRKSKEAVFREKVQAIAIKSEVVDLDPLLDQMRVVKSPAEIAVIREATRIAGLGILESFTFTDPKIKAAATAFVARYANGGRSFGHGVGLEVHDVAGDFDGVYKPGMIFTIEPALTIPDEQIYIRLEDVILITETGYENLSATLPMSIEEIERVMRESPRIPRLQNPQS